MGKEGGERVENREKERKGERVGGDGEKREKSRNSKSDMSYE